MHSAKLVNSECLRSNKVSPLSTLYECCKANTVARSSICNSHAVQMLGPKSPSLLLLAPGKNTKLQRDYLNLMHFVNSQPEVRFAVPTSTAGCLVEGIAAS